jgi:DNA-binding response OmpR family regulator
MDGKQLAACVNCRAWGEWPAIIVSADASRGHAHDLLAAGADAFLSKSIDAEELLSKIVALLKLEPTYEALQGDPLLEQQTAGQLPALQSQELELASFGRGR